MSWPLGSVTSLGATLAFIFRHPANRRRRLRALFVFAGWQVWKRTTGRPLTTTFWQGIRVRVYPNSKSAALALYTRLPEYNEMLFTDRLLKPGDVVVDVGANIGLYSLLAASRIGDGRVIALEPHPLAASRLRENVELNGMWNIEIRAEAAGAEAGVARLTAGLDTINHIVNDGEEIASVSVRVSALDDLILPTAQVALVKVDAEGFESLVLAGAARLLGEGSVLAWIVEVNGLGGRYRSGDQSVIETFDRFGYGAYRYDADHMLLQMSDHPGNATEWNLIFVRDYDEVDRRLRPATA